MVNDDISLNNLRVEIYRYLKISKVQVELKIRVKFNSSPSSVIFFMKFEILNNETWKFVVGNMGTWKVMDLFVDIKSRTLVHEPAITQFIPSSSQIYDAGDFELSQLPIETNEDPTYENYILLDRNSDVDDFEFDIDLDNIHVRQ
jgi:hypothetical protein